MNIIEIVNVFDHYVNDNYLYSSSDKFAWLAGDNVLINLTSDFLSVKYWSHSTMIPIDGIKNIRLDKNEIIIKSINKHCNDVYVPVIDVRYRI